MPANLTNSDTVFAESCCEAGGETTRESAQSCGCDPGLNNYLCDRHKFKARAMDLVAKFRGWAEQAQSLKNEENLDVMDTEIHAYLSAAELLEEIL